MPVKVKKVVLWRKEIENKAGVLASVLEPLAGARAGLQILMGYRYPGAESKAAIELYPIANKKTTAAARAAGLESSSIPALLVQGDDKPAIGHAIAKALGDAQINLGFLVAQVIGGQYSAVLGFDSEADADKAMPLIKKAGAGRK
jgi:hypothetical protein